MVLVALPAIFSLAGAAVGGDPGGGLGLGTALLFLRVLAPFLAFSRCLGGGPTGGAGLSTFGGGSTMGAGNALGGKGFVPLGGFPLGGLGPGMIAGGFPGGGLGLLMPATAAKGAGSAGLRALLTRIGGRILGKAKGFMPAGGSSTGGAMLGTAFSVSWAARG